MSKIVSTSTFTVNNVGDPEPVTVQKECHRVEVFESAATTDYDVFSAVGATGVRKPAGAIQAFEIPAHQQGRKYSSGQIVAYLATVVGTATFSQVEYN